jgi:two-component system response regulator AtoC
MKKILLVEDDEIMRITVSDRLLQEQWQVDAVTNGREALARIEQNNYHLILSDIRMPGLNGLELLERVKQASPMIDIFMMTAYGSVEDAVACLRQGAADYILKPFEMDDLIIRINRILEMRVVRARCASLEDRCRQEHQEIIGTSAAIRRILTMLGQIAPTDSTVLITGESATGKELAAKALHQDSLRADKPYIRINCAAIPEGLLESEFLVTKRGPLPAHTPKNWAGLSLPTAVPCCSTRSVIYRWACRPNCCGCLKPGNASVWAAPGPQRLTSACSAPRPRI